MIYSRLVSHTSVTRFAVKPWCKLVHVLKTTPKQQSFVSTINCTSKRGVKISKILVFTLPICAIGKVNFDKNKSVVLCDAQHFKDNVTEIKTRQNGGNVFRKGYQVIYKYLRLYLRLVRLSLTFLPVLSVYPIALLFPTLYQRWLRVLLYAVESSGPTFIKFGQWASTRRDIFSPEFCDCFSKLHHNAPAHSWFYTKKKLEKAFGKKWREIFVKIDNKRKAISSGCIGQVYKGYIRADKITDESLLEELLEDLEESDTPDFFEGLEILGFGQLFGTQDRELDQAEREWTGQDSELDQAERESTGQRQDTVTGGYGEHRDQLADSQDEVQQRKDIGAGEGNCLESQSSVSGVDSHGNTQTNCTDSNGPNTKDKASIHDDVDLQALIPVAIKVRHPSVYRCVSRDMKLLHFIASIASCLPGLKWLSLREIVEEFDVLLKNQIDFRVEAKNLERFNENFSDVSCIKFPKPLRPYVRRDVLVETFEEGEHITKYIQDNYDSTITEDCTKLKHKLAEIGVDAILKMVFVDNFVHADLHPGNILVQGCSEFDPDQESKLTIVDVCDTLIVNIKPVECPVKLIFLDTGIVSALGEEHRHSFRDVFTAVVQGDGERVAELFLDHSKCQQCDDPKKFKEDMSALVNRLTRDGLNLDKIQVGSLIHDVFNVLRQHKVKLESSFASMLLAIMVLEGLGRSLDPSFDIMQSAKSVLLS